MARGGRGREVCTITLVPMDTWFSDSLPNLYLIYAYSRVVLHLEFQLFIITITLLNRLVIGMADANPKRVIAYFYGRNNSVTQVKGKVIQILIVNHNEIYELMTDSPVPLRIRDAEIKLEAHRRTKFEYSLFVSAEQCAPETTADTAHTKPVTQSQHNSHSQTPSRPSRYKKGDSVTLPVEEVHSGLINGTVGYTGRYNNMEVVEICADQHSTTSSEITKIRDKFEVPNFPDGKRLNAMKGFSLVVRSDVVIPNDPATSSGDDRNQISKKPFSEAVGFGFHENPQPGNPPCNTYGTISSNIPLH